ncbi:hypothetical protein JOL62DRAFT_616198 [Phyllosticta paracitricarpa]|uniref:Uncharacterized protein n=1 Tax=Phyllosticta paracitricarpa TaxID=2016321 RepID=A0ABR1MU07_9PEZI
MDALGILPLGRAFAFNITTQRSQLAAQNLDTDLAQNIPLHRNFSTALALYSIAKFLSLDDPNPAAALPCLDERALVDHSSLAAPSHFRDNNQAKAATMDPSGIAACIFFALAVSTMIAVMAKIMYDHMRRDRGLERPSRI